MFSRLHSLPTLFSRRVGCTRGLASLVNAGNAVVYDGHTYPFRWLRDSCQCPDCVHPSTRQKLHRSTDIPADVRPAPHGLRKTDAGIEITWNSGHLSTFPSAFLQAYAAPSNLHQFHRDINPEPWNKEHISRTGGLFVSYDDMKKPSGILAAMTQLIRYGLVFVTGVSPQETSNEACETRKLVEKFGEIRSTFYGDLWDVINIRNSRNIAYTNLYLGLHMDLLYCHNPPRFQLLHCLRNRVHGGTSVFVDALDAAERLRGSHPEAFKLLTSTPVSYHYLNDGHHLHRTHPVIQLEECYTGDALTAPIKFINYSPPFQAPFALDTPPAFFPAFEQLVRYLDDPAAAYEYTLREGDAVLFDNRRVLHARTAFTDSAEGKAAASVGDTTNRWLKGCYFEADTMFSRGRVLRENLDSSTGLPV